MMTLLERMFLILRSAVQCFMLDPGLFNQALIISSLVSFLLFALTSSSSMTTHTNTSFLIFENVIFRNDFSK